MPEQSDSDPVLGLTDLKTVAPLEFDDGVAHPGLPPSHGLGSDYVIEPDKPMAQRKWYQGLGWGFWVAVAWVVLWILAAIFAGILPIANPNQLQADCFASASPSASHLLGCDPLGRDILSRVIYGSRVSLVVGFASIALSQVVGGTFGVIAGYFRGWFDTVMGVIANTFLSFPGLVLGLVIVAYLGNSEFDIVMIIAIVAWPLLFRVVRAATIEYSQREYVLAAQALGSTRTRILTKILLPDIIPSAITYGLVGVALAIVAEGALSYLGQSVGAPTATWGNMIALGSDYMPNYLSVLLSPAVAMFSFILAINFIGDRLRSLLDIREGAL